MLLNALSRTRRAGLTPLYFDRQRVLGEASSLPPDDPRRAALALRASELAARLDGWSGGVVQRATVRGGTALRNPGSSQMKRSWLQWWVQVR